MRLKFVSILTILLLFLTTSCVENKSARRRVVGNDTNLSTSNNQNTNQSSEQNETTEASGGTTEEDGTVAVDSGTGGAGECNGTGSEPGVADAEQTIDYYKINNPPIVAHGAYDGEVVWSSRTDLSSSISEDIFLTNARMNIRVIPRRQYHGVDSKGVPCQFQPRPYEKLQVGVRVRKRDAQTGDYYLFDNVKVDCASKVHEFQVPQNTADPIIVEVMNVKWDWSCQSYANQGYPNVAGVCPWDKVWLTECYQLEIQVSTDTTKDLPGLRTN